MARKNRKNEHEGSRMILWGVSLSVLAAALAMVYLSLYNTCDGIGRQIKKLEDERAELHKRVVNEERNWATACATPNMERLMAHHGIAMTWPAEKNIIRLRPAEPADPVHLAYQSGPTRRD